MIPFTGRKRHTAITGIFFVALFFVHLVSPQGWAVEEDLLPRHVLLLHSYNSDMTWVKNIEKGVFEELTPDRNNLIVHIEYMDSKRHHDSLHYQLLERSLAHKSQDFHLSLILCSDNNAFDFLMQRRQTLFPGVPIAFCGVNDYKPEMLQGHADITGVAEIISPVSTVELMVRLHPGLKHVYVINDYLTTGRAWRRNIEAAFDSLFPTLTIEYNDNLSIGELQEKIRGLGGDTAILLGDFFADRLGNYLSYEGVGAKLTSISPVPVYCLLDFNLRDGAVGGNVISGYSQGQEMARLGKQILAGVPVSTLPVIQTGVNKCRVDFFQLERFKVSTDLLPPDAVVLNRPFSFYENYKALIWGTLGAFLCLLLISVMLFINIHLRIRTEKELKASEIRFRNIFNNATVGIFQITLQGKIMAANPALVKMLGFDDQASVIAHYHDVGKQLYENSDDRAQIIERLAREGSLQNLEVPLNLRDGTRIWVSLNIHMVTDENGQIIYHEGTINDISQRKLQEKKMLEQEDELRDHRDRLKELVEERTEQLARVNADLEMKNEELEQIVYVASHDLRSPLVNIDGYSRELNYSMTELRQELEKILGHDLPPTVICILEDDIQEALRFIRTSAAKMDKLLMGLLHLSRSGRGVLSMDNIDMNLMISQVVDAIEYQIKASHVKVIINDLPPCRGDGMQINQVFSNIIGNALKYLDPGRDGVIEISGKIEDSQATYCVADNGIGMDPRFVHKIFEIFHRLDPAHSQGDGLGLAIVKRILDRLEGSIRVESNLGEYSRFYISFPQATNVLS
ncbi:ATP-binding protein [Desulfocicer niacini]